MQTVSDAEKIAIVQMHLNNIQAGFQYDPSVFQYNDLLNSAARVIELLEQMRETYAPTEKSPE